VPGAWLVSLLGAALGLAVGSFLNVVLTRVPRGESVVRPPSRCRRCGRRLRWWENVPVASWIALRGRCRTCGAPIGFRYLLVEAAAGLAGAVAARWWWLRQAAEAARG
jgi:leader peptidase (prepilin peptidase)/N-methyltransferase